MTEVFDKISSLGSTIEESSTKPQTRSKDSSATPSANESHKSLLRSGEELYNHLHKLNRDISALKKYGTPQLSDIQTFAERTWKVNVEYENYLARIARERQTLERLIESIWHTFDSVILPLWRVDDSLVAIYEQLASIRKQIESLHTLQKVNSNDRAEFLRQLQSQLHEIENTNVIDGKFIPPAVRESTPMTVPSGQAIVMSLLQKCYRLIRVMNETETVVVSPSLYPMENRLNTIIFDLESILAAYKCGEPVDPLELQMIQEHLLSIDRMQSDGKFVNPDGSIPEGQAITREKLELAFDLVHECLLNQPSKDESSSDNLISLISSTITETRDTLLSYATSITTAPLSTIQSLYSSLMSGVNYVRSGIPTLGVPPASHDLARGKMVSALRSGLNVSGKLFYGLEGVDDQLAPIVISLTKIRTKLRRLKNQRISYRIRKMTDRNSFGGTQTAIEGSGPEDAKKVTEQPQTEERPTAETKVFRRELEELQRELDEIDSKRVDGKFVDTEKNIIPKGQAYVHSLLDECYCLVFELLDFDNEREW